MKTILTTILLLLLAVPAWGQPIEPDFRGPQRKLIIHALPEAEVTEIEIEKKCALPTDDIDAEPWEPFLHLTDWSAYVEGTELVFPVTLSQLEGSRYTKCKARYRKADAESWSEWCEWDTKIIEIVPLANDCMTLGWE